MTGETQKAPCKIRAMNLPGNIYLGPDSYVDRDYAFHRFRSERNPGVSIGRGTTAGATVFDVTQRGQIFVGNFTVLNGVYIMTDEMVRIGSHTLISWEVVIMDSYRWPNLAMERRSLLEAARGGIETRMAENVPSSPVLIGNNVWIGFGSVVLPGVTIGDGAVIGAQSVLHEPVAPYSLYGGNPARFLKSLSTTSS